MKKIITAVFVAIASLNLASAQTIIIGEKTPDLKVAQWLNSNQVRSNTPTLLEFFVSQSAPSQKRLPVLDALAKQYGGKLNIVIISKESQSKIAPLIDGKNYSFAIAIDDEGKTFSNYGVQFVPFGILTDAKGRVVWSGNSSQLTNDIIQRAFK